MKNKNNVIYMCIQCLYWMLYCCYSGYVAFYFLEKGFSDGAIGIWVACFSVLTAFLQPVLGRIADKRSGWKRPLFFLLGALAADSILLMIVPGRIAQGIIFCLGIVTMGCMMPLINAAAFFCSAAGHKVDFGKARGMGSLGYGVLSFFVGRLTVRYGAPVLPIVSLSVLTFLIIFIIRFPEYKSVDNVSTSGTDETGDQKLKKTRSGSQGSMKEFISRYPALMLMVLAGAAMMAFHNMSCTYLLQIFTAVGGDSSSFGTAHTIAAVLELPAMFGYVRIRKHVSSDRLLIVAGVGFIIKSVMYVLAGSIGALYATQIMQMFSYAFFASASVYYAEEVCAPEDKATGQAFMSTSQTVGTIMGSLLGGILFSELGLKGMLQVGVLITVFSTVLAVAANIFGRRNKRKMVSI